MKKIGLMVLIVLFIGMYQGLPVYAEDSIDTQIMTNMADGIQFQNTHNYEDAIRCYTKIIELDPNNIEPYISRGSCYYFLKDYNASLKDINMVLSLNPNNYEGLYDKAFTESIMNDQPTSLKTLQQVLSMCSKWKQRAVQDKDFDNVRNTEQFRSLTGITVRIDGKVLESDTAPMVVGGRTLVPLGPIFNALGAKVEWDGENKTIHCTKDKTTLSLQIDNNEAKINDQSTILDTPAMISNNRTYVPLGFVAEALGATVNWLADTQEIYITTPDDNTGTAAIDEKEIINDLKKNLDYLPIIGGYLDPFRLDKTEGAAILVAKSQQDLDAFQSLNDENKKGLLNDYIQARWGDFNGCKNVRIYFVFDGKRYAETVTAYQTPSNGLNMYRFKLGIETDVVIQEPKNLFYYDYYGNKKPIFNHANVNKDDVSVELTPYDIYFNKTLFGSINYPKTWKIANTDSMVTFYAPPGDDDLFASNVTVRTDEVSSDVMKKLSDPNSYIEFAKHESAKYLTDLTFEKAELAFKKDWGNGYNFVYSFRQGQANIKGRSIAVVCNDGFIIHYEVLAEQKDYEKYNAIFDKMISSLSLNHSSGKST